MAAVQAGHFPDGHHHYQDWGKSQNRQISIGEIFETILSLQISNVSDALAVLTQASQDLCQAAASLQKMLVTSVGDFEKIARLVFMSCPMPPLAVPMGLGKKYISA